jgi:hypothetical protein
MIITEERARAGHTGDGVRAVLIISTLSAALGLLVVLIAFVI